jgi:peptidoglycan hydrolase CwlO-like protein
MERQKGRWRKMQNNSFQHVSLVQILKLFVWAVFLCGVMSGPAVIAQETARDQPAPSPTSPKDDEIEKLRKLVSQLSAEVGRLRAEVAKLEKYQQIDYLRAQLMKEEQRSETLHRELSDIAAKETPLQKRLDEIEPQLRPDRIERSLAGVGSTRPEEDRDAVRTQLSNERRRIQIQLDQFNLNRRRLQSSISTAEVSITVLRQRLSEAVRAARLSGRE